MYKITFILFSAGVFITLLVHEPSAKKQDSKSTVVLEYSKDIHLLQEDLSTNYDYISVSAKERIFKSILTESQKYNINPVILYAVLHTESNFQYWIQHKPIKIVKDGKKITIQAIGLGGIVWEWWGESLKAKSICETKTDLYNIENNIAATAYIYNHLLNMPLHPKSKNINESAMLRYFGGYYPEYPLKIVEKIEKVLKNN